MSDTSESAREMDHDKVLEQAAAWMKDGHKVALATVIETWGSAPRPAGSQLAIRDDATFTGSVSGGCIEGDVVTRALDKLDGGTAEIVEYGVSDARAWEVGLACGGRIRVMIEPVEGNA